MTSEQFEKKLEKNMTNLTEKQKDYLRDIFKANNDQKETNHESLTVENQPEEIVEAEPKTPKKGNMKRGKKS